MAQAAPELPTTEQLELLYAHDFDHINISAMRNAVSSILDGSEPGVLAMAGPCSFTGEARVIDKENGDLVQLMHSRPQLITLQRRNFWKPRTDPDDWHGPETTDPAETYRRVARAAIEHANGAAEIATVRHLERYSKLLSFAWFGARNSNIDQQIAIVRGDPLLPFGVKNSLNGDFKQTLKTVERLNQERGEDAAPIVLVYRGGENATSPDEWENQVREAHRMTGGRMVLDLAHGGEMAHDPEKLNQKSVTGQIACARHAIQLATEGICMAGYLMEASDIKSLTDPNMPHAEGLKAITQIARITSQGGK